MTLAIGLLVLAFVLVMMELTFPSFGLLSLGAATAYAFALVRAFELGTNTGWTFVVLGVFLLPIAVGLGLKVLPHTPIGRRLFLHAPTREEVQHGTAPAHLAELVGADGEALTSLRPAGSARIAGHRVDVVASGRFVEKGRTIRVMDVNGTRVVVREIDA